jgi:pimeloyl-ACP methyl ester carboxylesterase
VAKLEPAALGDIRLPDGRLLAYATWGDPDGRPVLFFHGMPSSRLQFPDPQAAADLHVNLISIDRPGIGHSDPQPGHRIVDWPTDVLVFADALELERFGVVGWSAGTPYALACAATIPDRMTGVGVTTSAAAFAYLYDDPEVRDSLLDDDDRAILAALPDGRDAAEQRAADDGEEWVREVAERPEELFTDIDVGDEWYFDDADLRQNALDAAQDALRQGAAAVAPQWVALVAPWGFRLENITIPVHFWAGAHDVTRPLALMHRLADRIPEHTFTVWDDVGHFGIAKHMREVLAEL